MATPSPKYQALVETMRDSVITGVKLGGGDRMNGLMLVCDVSAAVLLELYKTEAERMAALDIFLTRLGSVMDTRSAEEKAKPN